MPSRTSRAVVTALAIASLLGGCAHHPEMVAANDRHAVDVAQEHPRMSGLASICADRDTICILAGLAILGGTIAAIKGANE